MSIKTSQIVALFVLCFMIPQEAFAVDWDEISKHLNSDQKFLVCSKKGDISQITLSGELSGGCWFNIAAKETIFVKKSDLLDSNLGSMSLELWDVGILKWKGMETFKALETTNTSEKLKLTFSEEGFYRISDKTSGKKTFHMIVDDDVWVSLGKYLMGMKKEVENNPDPQLYKSSIFTSKINDLLREKPKKITQKYAQKLCQIVQEFRGLKEGECPDLTPGLYKFRLKRFPGAPVMEYVLRVPDNYDPNVKSVFVYHADERRVGQGYNYQTFVKYITLWCQSVTHENCYWDDFEYIFAAISKKLNIDPKRTHIVGKCSNGISAMAAALHHPDFWAGCNITLGNANRELASNAYNVNVKYSHSHSHQGRPKMDGWFTFAAKCFEYNRCPDFNCEIKEFGIDDSCIKNDIARNDSPSYIQYRTNSLKWGETYWLSIDSRKDEGLYADIKAKVIDGTIYIDVDNVESYSIRFDKAPVKGLQISIIETDKLPANLSNDNKAIKILRQYDLNLSTSSIKLTNSGEMVAEISNLVFRRYPARYANSRYLKSSQVSGGINGIFSQRYAVVCPYLEDEGNVYGQFAKKLAGEAPYYSVFDSSIISQKDHNISFIGTFGDFSALPDKVRDALPYRITEKTIVAAGKEYSGDIGVFSVYPNPLNPKKYLGVFICSSEKAAAKLQHVFMNLDEDSEFDIGVFSVTKKGELEWLIAEKFDATWDYHSDYGDVLVDVKKTQEWRWKAWRAGIIRRQMDADVGIFENCFKKSGRMPEGVVTNRDVHGYFKNTWIVKVDMKGRELKKILTVPFGSLNKRQVVPEISGVSFVKTKDKGCMYVGDIEEDKSYTLSCPQKILNGSRIGFCPEEYKIVDEGFAVDFLLDYLRGNGEIDLNRELAGQKLRVF